MNLKFLTGDINWTEYGGKFVTKKLNNGDFDYWLVLLTNQFFPHNKYYYILRFTFL